MRGEGGVICGVGAGEGSSGNVGGLPSASSQGRMHCFLVFTISPDGKRHVVHVESSTILAGTIAPLCATRTTEPIARWLDRLRFRCAGTTGGVCATIGVGTVCSGVGTVCSGVGTVCTGVGFEVSSISAASIRAKLCLTSCNCCIRLSIPFLLWSKEKRERLVNFRQLGFLHNLLRMNVNTL